MREKLDAALYIFGISLLGYGATYLHSLGFKDYYLIPSDFIDLDISAIADNLTVTFVIIGLSALQIFEITRSKLGHIIDTNLRKLKIFLFRNLNTARRRLLRNVLVAPLGMALWVSLMGIIFNTGIEKIHSVFWFSIEAILTFLIGRPKNFFRVLYIVVGLVAFLSYCYIHGFEKAANEDTYLRVVGTNLIVIDYYKDKAIVTRADFDKHIIYPEYQFLKLGTSKLDEATYKMIQVGKLKVIKQLPSE